MALPPNWIWTSLSHTIGPEILKPLKSGVERELQPRITNRTVFLCRAGGSGIVPPPLIITKTHQPSGGIDTPTKITPYPGSRVFFQPSITLHQQTLYTESAERKVAFLGGNWKICTHNVHSAGRSSRPVVRRLEQRGDTRAGLFIRPWCSWQNWEARSQRWEEQQKRQTLFHGGTGWLRSDYVLFSSFSSSQVKSVAIRDMKCWSGSSCAGNERQCRHWHFSLTAPIPTAGCWACKPSW